MTTGIESSAHLRTGQIGEHEIEQDEVGRLLARQSQALGCRTGAADLVAGLREVVAQHLLKVLLVFDHDDASHGGIIDRSHGTEATFL
jgi:hypothetical protein